MLIEISTPPSTKSSALHLFYSEEEIKHDESVRIAQEQDRIECRLPYDRWGVANDIVHSSLFKIHKHKGKLGKLWLELAHGYLFGAS